MSNIVTSSTGVRRSDVETLKPVPLKKMKRRLKLSASYPAVDLLRIPVVVKIAPKSGFSGVVLGGPAS